AVRKGLPETADPAVVEVDDLAVTHPALEGACVVAVVAVVPTTPVVTPAAAPVGVAGVDRDPALDEVAVALAVDIADVGHPRLAAVGIAVGVVLRGTDALLDRLARASRPVVVALIAVVAAAVIAAVVMAVVVACGCGHGGDPADDQRPGDDVAGVDAVVVSGHRRRRRPHHHRASRDGSDRPFGQGFGKGLHSFAPLGLGASCPSREWWYRSRHVITLNALVSHCSANLRVF